MISFEYVPISNQFVDLLTKGLSEQAHEFLVGKLGLINIYNQALRGVKIRMNLIK